VASPTLTTTGTAGPNATPRWYLDIDLHASGHDAGSVTCIGDTGGQITISAVTGRFGFGRTVPAIFHPLLLVRFILPL
jgi:hypothetical protein